MEESKTRFPCVLLRHIETGKFHPVPFKRYPFPGGAELSNGVDRYKSIGHLPDGLDTFDLAIEYMKNYEKAEMDFSNGEIVEWDGTTENAAMVRFFKTSPDDFVSGWF